MAAALVAVLVTAVGTLAHSPLFNDTGTPTPQSAFIISDIGLSVAILGGLRDANAVDYYRIDVPAGHTLDFGLLVPEGCGDFRPSMAFFGPDLTGSGGPLPARVVAPPGTVVIVPERAEWGTFFEPFDPSVYATGPEVRHTAAGGAYYVAVYHPDGETGAYLLSMAGREEFSGDADWRERKAAYDRCEIGQGDAASGLAESRPSWSRLAVMGLGAAAVAAGGVYVFKRQQPR
jgi:hypothetical protein